MLVLHDERTEQQNELFVNANLEHTVEYNNIKFAKSIVIFMVNKLVIMDNVTQYMASNVSSNKITLERA